MGEARVPFVALTIGGSDSAGGSGIQADLKTFAALGVYGACAVAAVASRTSMAVTGVEQVTPELVRLQIDAVMEDIGAQAVKTGMLSSPGIVAAVAQKLDEYRMEKTVVDPVMVSKSGDQLLEPEAVATLRCSLVPKALVITPNLPEAGALVGFAVEDESSIKAAARRLVEMGAKAAVITGGYGRGDECVDWFYDGRRFSSFSAPRLPDRNTCGAGSTSSAAIAGELARGSGLEDAVGTAKQYLSATLERGIAIGNGHRSVDHFMGRTLWPEEL